MHAYGVKMDCKDLKISLRDEKRPNVSFYRKREETPHHPRSAIEANRLLCQPSIEYWCYANQTQYIHIHIYSL